ncbi:MAG: cupin domain-containing protein [Pseudomonadota bacterium]|nr:cupin domain-containing protein [Pseudomonadota bacterium]
MNGKASPPTLRDIPAILTPDHAVDLKAASTPNFYQELDSDYGGFKGHVLISEHAFSADWGVWEVHPAGDEFIYLLEGAADFVCYAEGRETVTRLDTPGQFVVVPRDAWHTARTTVPTRALFVTPGAGTRHSDDPRA